MENVQSLVLNRIPIMASVYVGLDDYSLENNILYLERLKYYQVKRVFISAHMPEKNENFEFELQEIVKHAHNIGLQIVLDVNKSYFNEIKASPLYKMINIFRLDYGFSKEEIYQTVKDNIEIELNASAISKNTIEYLNEKGLDLSKIRVSHNFYPKPYTGLSYKDVYEKNKYFHLYNMTVIMYIPSTFGKRMPLYEGLPTIEQHRHSDIIAIMSDAKKLEVDELCFGDAFCSNQELEEAINFDSSIVQIPIIIKKGLSKSQLELLNQVHINRIDANEYFVRSSVRSLGITPFNTVDRKRGFITIDNCDFLRYQGEVGIMIKDLPSDKRVNVVGRCINSDYLIDNIKPNEKFKFVIRYEE